MKIIIIGLLLGLGMFQIAQAASFDCERATMASERTICTQREINDADVKMATTYNIVRKLVPMGNRGVIRDQQVKWLVLRDQCQSNVQCLAEVYKMRQQKLDLEMSRIYKQGPF